MIHKTTNPIAPAFCCVGLLVGLALAGLPEKAEAVLMTDGTNEADYRSLAQQYSNSLVFIHLADSVGPYYGSGVLLNNSWVLTAAHVVVNPFGSGNDTILGMMYGATTDGPSGTPLTPATETYIYPGYTSGAGPNIPDVMLIKVSPGIPAPNLAIGSASAGAVVTHVGFGLYGTPTGGLFQLDGNARAWRATLVSSALGGYSAMYYQSSLFGPSQNSIGLNGRGLSADSGGPVFNSQGELVGITVAGGGGLTPIGSTEFLTLSQPDVYAWIQQTITPAEPKILSLTQEGSNLRLVWQGKGGSNYVVQAASAVGGTNTFTDLTTPLTLPGVGPITTNFLDLGVLTNAPARFYRIRLN